MCARQETGAVKRKRNQGDFKCTYVPVSEDPNHKGGRGKKREGERAKPCNFVRSWRTYCPIAKAMPNSVT